MRMSRQSRDRVHLVTQARTSKSEDIGYRERRYLIMMGIRLVCFVGAVLVFVNGGGWLTAFPAVGAVIIPYFAVVFANGGREPNNTRGFQEYQPNLPEPVTPPLSGPVYLRDTEARIRQDGAAATETGTPSGGSPGAAQSPPEKQSPNG